MSEAYAEETIPRESKLACLAERPASLVASRWGELIVVAVAIILWLPRLSGPIDLRWDAGVYYLFGTLASPRAWLSNTKRTRFSGSSAVSAAPARDCRVV